MVWLAIMRLRCLNDLSILVDNSWLLVRYRISMSISILVFTRGVTHLLVTILVMNLLLYWSWLIVGDLVVLILYMSSGFTTLS